MKRHRLYLDSSVIGWSLNRGNAERYAEANRLLSQIADGRLLGAYSWVMAREIDDAPARIRERLWRKVREACLREVPREFKKEASELANAYCSQGIVPSDFVADALHIAIATLWRADALVSYNFGHIVNLDTMVEVNRVNRERGLHELFLCQPKEVIIHED
jgi:hypothetical protein